MWIFHFYVVTFRQHLEYIYIYIFQLIPNIRACIFFHDFLERGLLLTRNILNQEFQMVKLNSYLHTFYGRHYELVDRWNIRFRDDIWYVPYIVANIRFPLDECDKLNLTVYLVCNNISYSAGTTYGAGSSYPTETHKITPVLCRVSFLVFSLPCCVLCSFIFLFGFLFF